LTLTTDSAKPCAGPTLDISYRLSFAAVSTACEGADTVAVHADYAQYTSSYKLEGNTLIVRANISLAPALTTAARSSDYIAFVAAARADEAQTLALKRDEAGTPAIAVPVKS